MSVWFSILAEFLSMKDNTERMKSVMTKQLEQVEQLAGSSKLGRLLHHPSRYISALWFRKFIYPKDRIERRVSATLFYGKEMKIALPAATDIYLTGGKSHDSEIRLARFLIKNLSAGKHFLDIGAHYGYFSMIAAEIVGTGGKVFSFEPTTKTYELLQENAHEIPCMTIFRKAVSDTGETLVFHEFPNKYSEYNSVDVSQFENEKWYQESQPQKVEVPATTIDGITSGEEFRPHIIKIDVEGAEYKVIQGGRHFLGLHAPLIVMEYLEPKRHNEVHQKAVNLLQQLGYKTCVIRQDGSLSAVSNIDAYLLENKMDSDNIVFMK